MGLAFKRLGCWENKILAVKDGKVSANSNEAIWTLYFGEVIIKEN